MLVLTNNKILRISKCIQHYFSSVDEKVVLSTFNMPKPSNTKEIFKYISSQCKHFTIREKDLKL